MHKERNRLKIMGKQALLLTTALAIGVPLYNSDTTKRVFAAAIGQPVNCPPPTAQSFDALAVFDGGPIIGKNGEPFPNANTRKRLKAAAIKYAAWTAQGHRPGEIIFLNSDHSNTNGAYPALFRRYVATASSNKITVPESSLVIEKSVNTSESAEDLARITASRNLKHIAVFTTKSHLPRAMILTCGWKVPATGFVAEDVLIAQNPEDAPVINAALHSRYAQNIESLEFWKRAMLPYDSHGRLLRWLKLTTRNDTE